MTLRPRGMRTLIIAGALLFAGFWAALPTTLAETSSVTPWPPVDPNQYVTSVPFTVKWAKRLRGFRTLADLQRAAGSRGTISDQSLEGKHPNVLFHWRSEPQKGIGYMLATVYRDGGIGVSVLTIDNARACLQLGDSQISF